MLLLRLLQESDMYGYQMIEELARRSNDTFSLKAGTLLSLIHIWLRPGQAQSSQILGQTVGVGHAPCLGGGAPQLGELSLIHI